MTNVLVIFTLLYRGNKTKPAFLFFLCVMFKMNSLAPVSPQGRASTLMKKTSKGFILPSFISCPQKVRINKKELQSNDCLCLFLKCI